MSKTVIFGATGAIGSALAAQLHADGKQLHLVGRDKSELEQLARRFQASYSIFDAEDHHSITAAVEDGTQQGGVEGVIWAVGNILLKPLAKLTATDIQSCFQLNLFGAITAIQASINDLKTHQGSVLLFSSVAAQYGFTSHAAIGSAKAAINGLVVSLAAELSPEIRVNAIAPSLSESKMAAPIMGNPQMAKALAAAHPLGRLGNASDFAPLGALLMDNQQSGWITGQILAVDGGRSSLQAGARAKSA